VDNPAFMSPYKARWKMPHLSAVCSANCRK
jgi:hypothetical protein